LLWHKLAKTYCQKHPHDFWSLVNKLTKPRNSRCAPVVDGVSDGYDIANLWASKLQGLLNTHSSSLRHTLLQASNISLSLDHLSTVHVSIDDEVQVCFESCTCIKLKLYLCQVPSSAPTRVTVVNVTSTTLSLEWDPLTIEDHNGVITGYVVNYSRVDTGSTVTVVSSTTSVYIGMLRPYTTYSFSVAAETSVGSGPFSPSLQRTTAEDGMSQIECSLYYDL